MRLWRNLPDRLVENLSNWKIVFIVFLSIDVTLGNLMPEPKSILEDLLAILTMGVYFASVLLSRDFSRRIASGKRQLNVHGIRSADARQRWILWAFRWLAPFTRYVVMFLVFLALNSVYDQLIDIALPSFSADQNLDLPEGNVWIALGVAAIACLEEYWRWAIIITVLLLVKALARQRWAADGRLKSGAFALAVVVSSLLFGLGHYEEFTVYKGWSVLVLGGAGLLFAIAAIVTRRFVVAVALHFVYDFLAMSDLYSDVYAYIWAAAAISVVVILPVFLWLLRKVRSIQASAA